MADNVNPDWLQNCTRNPECSQMTCQANGELTNFFSNIMFMDMSCLTTPGVRMVFFQYDGREGVDVLVNGSQVLTSTNHAIGGQLTIVVLAQSKASHSINITVRNLLHIATNV